MALEHTELGAKAFHEGKSITQNPYNMNPAHGKGVDWAKGYNKERNKQRYANLKLKQLTKKEI